MNERFILSCEMASRIYGFIWTKRDTRKFDERGAIEVVAMANLIYKQLELEDEKE
jgi:hypothetical protein